MPATMQRDPIARSRAKLFGLANRLWAENPAAKSEELHMLVGGITGKESIKELSAAEFAEVNKELEARLAARGIPAYSKAKSAPQRKNVPGMATKLEQDKMWKLMYLIIGCDEKPDKTTAGARMCGAVKEILGMDVGLEKTLDWVKKEQAFTMIESLKGYLKTAQKEKVAREAAGK